MQKFLLISTVFIGNVAWQCCSFAAELGDYDPAEHVPELVSEFRFVPTQTEEMELAIFEKWKECRY